MASDHNASPLAGFGDLTAALEHLGLPAFAMTREGTILWLNAAAKEVVGDAEGLPYSRIVAAESRARVGTELARKVLGVSRAAEYEIMLVRPDGSQVPAEVSSVAVDEGGRVIGVFGVVQVSGADLPASEARGHLSPRQAQVLSLLARGCSTNQMARELGLSEATVRNHIRDLLRRLGVHSRLAAVVEGRRLGLV